MTAARISTAMDFFAAPSARSSPATAPFRTYTVLENITGSMYSLQWPETSPRDMTSIRGPRERYSGTVMRIPTITDSASVCATRLSASPDSPLPRCLAMVAAAPIPMAVPIPEMIQ